MKLNEWLENPANDMLLREHNEALEKAKMHGGNRAEQKGSLRRLLRRFKSQQKKHEAQARRQEPEVLFIPSMYPPCTILIENLKKTMIKDLRFDSRSLDSYILVRTVNQPAKMSTVMVIVEDENENVVLLRILREWLICHDHRLGEDMVLLVKQPCLQWISDKEYEIRVDHVSDIMFVPLFDERVPLSWRDKYLKDISEWSFEKWAEMGDEASKKGEHVLAVEWYTKALECSPPADIAAIILFLRSDGYLQAHQYEAALHDLEKVTVCPELSEHLLRRKAQVFYHLQRYQECCETYKAHLQSRPGLHSDTNCLNNAIERLAEQQHGRYDFKAMQNKAVHSTTLLLDHATYQGPVVLKKSKIQGRGLFTTKAVKAGDLLLCEKAFSYLFSPHKTINPPSNTLQVNTETKLVSRGASLDLTTATMTKMQKCPSEISKITNLHHGTFPKAITTDATNNPLIDTFLVTQITTLNSFGSPISSQTPHTNATNHKRISSKLTCHGIWPLASYINHACVSNTRRSFIGDMMIVRAAGDLPPDTELTWWYVFPSKEGVADTSHWGFECVCPLCVSVRGTEKRVLDKRGQLRGQIWGDISENASLGREFMERRIGELEGTYADGVRFGVWDLEFGAAGLFLKGGEEEKAIEFVFRGFEALGFEVEGIFPRGREVVVKTWGVVVDELVRAWVVLYLAFLKVEPELARMADRYARLTYLICVGEDGSFDQVYGKSSGRPYGPIDSED